MGKKWIENLHVWTEATISHATRSLTHSDVQVEADAAKTLKLSITEARLIFGAVMSRCILNLHIEIGAGHTRDFEGNNTATAGINYLQKVAIDGAAAKAVIAMLSDEATVNDLND